MQSVSLPSLTRHFPWTVKLRFPSIRERVRVEGHEGTFLVVGIDRATGTADVISTSRGGRVFEVKISDIKPLSDAADKPSDGDKAGNRH